MVEVDDTDGDVLLAAHGVRKSYGGVQALRGVDLTVRAGEIHALLGQNGAGKSTLIKVIAGAVKPEAGQLHWCGSLVDLAEPRDALELGVRVIYQHLHLVEHLSIADNFSLGNEDLRAGMIDRRQDHARAVKALARLGVDINPNTRVSRLATAERQLVEIARAIASDARLLIMDEPTASLGSEEVDQLLRVVQDLAAQGLGIIFISHRLEEIFSISHRITVLRDGASVGTYPASDLTRTKLISLMVGKDLQSTEHTSHATMTPLLEVTGISTSSGLKNISFECHQGEVLGFFGLLGAGRSELARALFGADPLLSGQITLSGIPLHLRDPGDAVAAGIGMVPEDRARQGALLQLSIMDNITAASGDLTSRWGWRLRKREQELAREGVDRLAVRTPSIFHLVANLSGGNQQKVVLGKWLVRDMRLLVLDEPTVGIDVGAKSEIYEIVRGITDAGNSVILMSSEISEMMTLCDRVAVLHEGRITEILERNEFSSYKFVQLAMEGVAP